MKSYQTDNSPIAALFVVLTSVLFPVQICLADHAQVLTDDIEFSCDQTDNNEAISCAYRFVDPDITKQITATLGTTELPILDIKTYPYEDSTTSILFLIDSSKSENPDQIGQIQNQIIALTQQALPYQQIGLATFDASLKIVKPLGSDPEDIIQVAREITETEQPTELYRNILDALNLLKTSQSDRKALYVFSSGKSEDQAVYQNDVIDAANEAGIKIISVAYPIASIPVDTTRNLRRLSKDSGGTFIKASEDDFELPESFISDPYAAIDNGGILTIDLTPVLTGDFHGLQLALLKFETTSKRITVKLPLELSSSNHSTAAHFKGTSSTAIGGDPGQVEAGDKSSVEKPVPTQKNTVPDNNKPGTTSSISDYWPVIPVGLLLLGLLAFFLSKNKKHGKPQPQEDDGKPVAYLVSLTDDSLYYPVDSMPWKVGRTRENDLFLEHSSVSRNHAELKRNRDGSFTVTDLDSLNGVFVNNTKVSTGMIKDEDKIDIGDVRLRFVLKIDESIV